MNNSRIIVPGFSLGLGAATGFFLRDELYMPTYLKIKVATMQHRLLTRQPLSSDLLSLIDQNHGHTVQHSIYEEFDEQEE